MPLSPPQLTVRYVAIIERRYLTFGCISPQGGVNTHWAVMHQAERATVGARFILGSICVVHEAPHGEHQLSGEIGMPKRTSCSKSIATTEGPWTPILSLAYLSNLSCS
jgi:hypothetical protein